MNTDRSDSDRGFTLVEMVICIALVGILMPVVASVLIVTLRTSPALSNRADVAVNVQGLVTWLPQDVDSTDPGSFETDQSLGTGCAGIPPTNSRNVLRLSWAETITSTTTYFASYRYVEESDPTRGGKLYRYTCTAGGTAKRLVVSGLLPQWVVGSEPIRVTPKIVAPATKFNQVTFEVDPFVGQTVTVLGTTKNPNETLPSSNPSPIDPNPGFIPAPNVPPVVDAGQTVTMDAGSSRTVNVSATDANGGVLTVSIPSPPAGWTIAVVGPLQPLSFNVTAPSVTAVTTVTINVVVTDESGATGAGAITFTVNPLYTNQPPQALSTSGATTAGVPALFALAPYVSDPENETLILTMPVVPVGWTRSISGLNVTINPPLTAAVGNSVLAYTVTDPQGLSATSTITLAITGVGYVPPPNSPPDASDVTVNIKANDPTVVSLSASDPDGNVLTASVTPPSDWVFTSTGTLKFNVKAPISAAGSTVNIPYTVTDTAGATDTAVLKFVVASTNLAPQASPTTKVTEAPASFTVALPASDPENATLTASVANVPVGWTATISGLNVTILAPAATSAGNYVLNYTVTDPGGLTASSTLTVTVTAPPKCVISGPTLSRTSVRLKNNSQDGLEDDVNVTINIVNEYCVGLSLHYVTGGANSQSPRNFPTIGTVRTVQLPKHPSTEVWTSGTKVLKVIDSTNTVIASVTLTVTQ